MSESKETESGADAQPQAASESTEASSDVVLRGDEANDDSEANVSGEASAAPRKKKKARAQSEGEPETIRDRNARVRAEAADKRRARREREQGGAPRRNLDASEVMDDALARSTHAAAGFLTKHFNKVQWLIMAGLVGWVGYEVYAWRHARTTEKSTEQLFTALSAEMGKVGAGEPDLSDNRGLPADERRSFASEEERLKAAKSEYQLAATSTGSVLADLGAAGVAYDLGQYKEAQTWYEKVKQSSAFSSDTDIKGRTLEGLGMTLEAQKNEDAALKVFRELQNMDSASFAALGFYHQARMAKAQGKTEDTLKLLDKAGEKLVTLKETPAVIRYVGRQVLELLDSLDPKRAKELGDKLISSEAKKQREEAAALGGGKNLGPDLQRKLQEMVEKMKKEAPPASSGSAPAAPLQPVEDAPAPAPSGAP